MRKKKRGLSPSERNREKWVGTVEGFSTKSLRSRGRKNSLAGEQSGRKSSAAMLLVSAAAAAAATSLAGDDEGGLSCGFSREEEE